MTTTTILSQRKINQITVSISERWSVNDTGVKEDVVAFIAENSKGRRK